MPVYEYQCEECGRISEVVCSIAAKPVGILCTECGKYARGIISKPQAVRPEWDEYWDENLGHEPVLVKGRQHRRELMKANGLEEVSYDKTKKRILIEKQKYNKRRKEELRHG